MNKSMRTQQRYAAIFKNQTQLDSYLTASEGGSSIPKVRRVSDRSISSVETEESLEFISDHNREISAGPSIPESELTVTMDSDREKEISDEDEESIAMPLRADAMETWAEELEEDVNPSQTVEIKDWETLRKQIKDNLKKKVKSLTLSEINKLMILSNFATLRLKGRSLINASLQIAEQWHEGKGVWFARRVQALARHYQMFEQLPVECRGGLMNAQSLLKDELVKKGVLNYLQNLPTGKVTPKKLRTAVNTIILPDLGINPKKPISVRTATHWLIKLGWRYTHVKKGVYMDGHEREDVADGSLRRS